MAERFDGFSVLITTNDLLTYFPLDGQGFICYIESKDNN